MSKSKKNIVDPESMINIYGADTRWFMLSDSPPDRDIQWSNEGVAAAHKFVQRIWLLNEKILIREEIKSSKKDKEKEFSSNINKYLYKITNLIEKFQLNVAIASIYEIVRYMEESLRKTIKNQHFLSVR